MSIARKRPTIAHCDKVGTCANAAAAVAVPVIVTVDNEPPKVTNRAELQSPPANNANGTEWQSGSQHVL